MYAFLNLTDDMPWICQIPQPHLCTYLDLLLCVIGISTAAGYGVPIGR